MSDHHGAFFSTNDHGLNGNFHGNVDVNSHGTTVCGSGSLSGHPIDSGAFHDTTISAGLNGCISSNGASSYGGSISVNIPLSGGW